DGGFVHVAGEHGGVLRQDEQLLTDAAHLLFEASAGQVRPANRAAKERVAAKQRAFFGVVADAAWRVSGRADGQQPHAFHFHDVAIFHEGVRVRRAVFDVHPHALGHALPAVAQQLQVIRVQQELRAGGGVDAVHAEDMIHVSVRVRDELDGYAHVPRQGEDFVRLVPGVDADRLPCTAVADDPAVLLEHANHHAAQDQFIRYFHARSVQVSL